jgi:DNA-binding transcriptional LysR family regulator
MRDLDLTSLRLFVAVCDLQNIARAAEQEHIVASAISKRIAQMEEVVGVPLLERRRRGVKPTPAGEAVLENARTVLYTMDRIAADVASFGAGMVGHVRVVASISAIAESLLDDIAAFMRAPDNRNIKVDIEERHSRDIAAALRDGNASVGVCWDNIDFTGLEHRPYRRDQLALAVHRDHPLAARRAVSFEQTLEYEHVGLQPSTAVYSMLQRAAARAGQTLSLRAVVSNFDAAFRVVAAGLAISVIPEQVAAGYAKVLGVKIVPLTDAWASRRFAVCFRRFELLPPAAQRLVRHLAQASEQAAEHVVEKREAASASDGAPPAKRARARGRGGRS